MESWLARSSPMSGLAGSDRMAVDRRPAAPRACGRVRGWTRRLTAEGRWMAAVLAGGAGAVLSHGSAGALWGIRPSQVQVSDVTIDRQLRPRPDLRFHRSYLPTDEMTTHDGIPVTTVPRTLFDLAGVVSRRAVRAGGERGRDPPALGCPLPCRPARKASAAPGRRGDQGRDRRRLRASPAATWRTASWPSSRPRICPCPPRTLPFSRAAAGSRPTASGASSG